MSFSRLCLMWRPALRRQDIKPCRPRASTRQCSAPLGHVCGSHSRVSSRVPTARRMVSLDILKPIAVIGVAKSQSPECGAWAANNLALSLLSSPYNIKLFLITAIYFISQAFWLCPSLSSGADDPDCLSHRWRVGYFRRLVRECVKLHSVEYGIGDRSCVQQKPRRLKFTIIIIIIISCYHQIWRHIITAYIYLSESISLRLRLKWNEKWIKNVYIVQMKRWDEKYQRKLARRLECL